jgi:TRAP-type C4-dicarboxylate transport system substrate-binding protein
MRARIWIVAALALLAPGCANTGDKAGGSGGGEPLVLRLANGNSQPAELQAFADEVRRRSGGALRIEFVNEWRKNQLEYEPRLIDDVKRGKAELGWVGARAFPALGVHSFDALLAPLLVDGYALERRAIEQLGEEMLAGAADAGVHPIALLPGPLRMVIARKPVTRPGDLAGLRLLLQPAGVEEAAARALGAEPVGGPSGALLGDLDGSVQHQSSIRGNHYYRDARFVTADVVLWPRPLVVFAGAAEWERLSEAQRSILDDAGRAAVAATVTAIEDGEAAALEDICTGGGRLVRAGAAGRAAMRSAVEPVYAQLRERPATAREIAAIERLRDSTPAAPSPRCAAPREPAAQTGGIRPGSYVATITRRDTSGLDPSDPLAQPRSIRFRAVFTPGHLVIYESYDGAAEDIGLEADYTVFRDRLELALSDGAETSMRWSVDGGRLRFTDIEGPGPGDAVVFGSHPWVRLR